MAHCCPADEIIAAYVKQAATPEERRLVEAHLAGCDDCCELVSFLVGLEEKPRPAPDHRPQES